MNVRYVLVVLIGIVLFGLVGLSITTYQAPSVNATDSTNDTFYPGSVIRNDYHRGYMWIHYIYGGNIPETVVYYQIIISVTTSPNSGGVANSHMYFRSGDKICIGDKIYIATIDNGALILK
jgi:hypothetical protein